MTILQSFLSGTGTPVGDPIEANTLGNFFGHNNQQQVYIASVKTNIGHLESAAGAAGLIKVLLMMKHQTIVPSLHFKKSNKMIDFEKYQFIVPTQTIPWKSGNLDARLACANSFGFGGTNSHVIIKEYVGKEDTIVGERRANQPYLVFLSASDHAGTKLAIQSFVDQLNDTSPSLKDISYTSLCRRDHFNYRVAFYAENINDLKVKIRNREKSPEQIIKAKLTPPKVVAVFCGVGTTWRGMCKQLLTTNTVVQDVIRKIDSILSKWLDWSIYDILISSKDISSPMIAHVSIFTCQVALWTLWRHFGLKVDAVIGQSVGEVAAAYAVDSLTLEQAVEIIYHRSQILANITGGKMFVIGNCQVDYIESVCSQFQGKACIAVYNSSTSCTVSCDFGVIGDVKAAIRNGLPSEHRATFFEKDLDVQCAYHSHHTEQAGNNLQQALGNLKSKSPSLPFFSTVSGTEVKDDCILGPIYWNKNVAKPVLFKQAVTSAGRKQTFNIFLEIGPKPVLRTHLKDSYTEEEAISLPSMKEKNEVNTFSDTLCKCFESGLNLNWNVVSKENGKLCDLPKYSFNPAQKGLFQSDKTLLKRQGLEKNLGSHLFVERTPDATATFRVTISEKDTPFVFEHYVSNSIVVPGAFYVEVALEVAHICTEKRVQDIAVAVEFVRPIVLTMGKTYSTDVTVYTSVPGSPSGILRKGKEVISNFRCHILNDDTNMERIDLQHIRQDCDKFQKSEDIYKTLNKLGFSYGEGLQILGDSYNNSTQSLVDINVSDLIWKDIKRTNFHPSILDAMFQTLGILQTGDLEDRVVLPAGISFLSLRQGMQRKMIGYTEIIHKSSTEIHYNLILLTTNGDIIAEIKNFRVRFVDDSAPDASLEYTLTWEQVEITAKENSSIREKDRKGILMCSFDQNILANMPESLKDIEKVLLDIPSTLFSKKKMISTVLQKHPDISKICYIPGFQITESLSGNNILDIVNSSCISMLAILQSIKDTKKDVSVTLITENTQVHNKVACQRINLLGAELWGQVRSILREHESLDIRLVDCHPSINVATEFIVQVLYNESTNKYGELLYDDGKVFTNYLYQVAFDQQLPKYRQGTIDDFCQIELKTERQHDSSQKVCFLQEPIKEVPKNKVALVLAEACMHNKELYPITLPESRTTLFPQQENNESGFHLLTMEATAKIQPSFGCMTDSQTKGKVVVVYPMVVKTTVVVPSSCVYPLESLKGYRPGVVLITVLLHALSQEVEKEQFVQIITDEENAMACQILKCALTKIKTCRVYISSSTVSITTSATIIPLKQIKLKEVQDLVENGSTNAVIALSPFLSHDVRMVLEMNSISVKLVHIDDILSAEYITRISPCIFKFLNRYLKHISNITAETTSVLHIPCQTFSMAFENLSRYNFVKTPPDMLFRKDCCYVVVGGLTGLGWEIVNFIASCGAGEVVSLSRRKIDVNLQNEVDKVSKRTQCRIRALSTDITILDDLRIVFQEISETTNFKIKGIFQGAGILRDTLSSRMNERQLQDVLKPKILGTWNLHLVSREYPLDYFVMHSSMTSVMGNIGQSNYGAANAFMDCLSHFRQMNGLCGQSINWGPLEVGMLKNNTSTEQILKDQGYFPLPVSDIFTCLRKNLHCNSIQVMFGLFDWSLIWKALTSMKNDLLRLRFQKLNLLDNIPNESIDSSSSNDELLDVLQSPVIERIPKITKIVLRIASDALALDASMMRKETLISELGIDSMQSMAFTNKIHDITGVRIPVVTLMSDETSFEYIIEILNNNIKEATKGTPLEDTLEQSIAKSMTPMEKKYYDSYLFNPNDPSLICFADLEVSTRLADIVLWKKVLHQVHERHVTLRTLLLPDQNARYGIIKNIVKPEDANVDFRVVPLHELEHDGKLPPDITQYLFNPSKDFPMRVMFAKDEKKCFIRIVFSQLLLDFTSILIVVNDLSSFEKSENLKSSKGAKKELDIAIHYDRKLKSQKLKLTKFWEKQTPRILHHMSLKNLHIRELNPRQFNFTKMTVKKEIVTAVADLMNKENVKLFDIITSLYQLLLSLTLQTDLITLFTTVDMRVHFPELQETVCRFTNSVPLYAKIDRDKTFLSFLKSNKMSILGAIDSSLLPCDTIIKLLKNLAPADVMRHQLVMTKVRGMRDFQDAENMNEVKMKRISAGAYYNETTLYVWNDMENNYLEIELAHSTLAVDNSQARYILNILLQWLQTVTTCPSTLIDLLIMQSTTSHVNDKEPIQQMRIKSYDENVIKNKLNDGRFSGKRTFSGIHLF